jgi:hypothetical protein
VPLPLTRYSLRYLDRLLTYEQPHSEFLAAITVHGDASKYLTPYLFICSGRVKEQLQDRLILEEPQSPFAKRILNALGQLADADEFQVLQDDRTVPDMVRVFIGKKTHPSPLMVGIDCFKKEALSGRLRN